MTLKKNGVATGFIGRVGAVGNTTNYQTTGKLGDGATKIRRILNAAHGGRMLKSILLALTGTVVGGASKAYTVARISERDNMNGSTGAANGSLVAFGGKRSKVTVTKQSGVTVAQDLTDFDTLMAQKNFPSTYPADKSGFKPGNIGRL